MKNKTALNIILIISIIALSSAYFIEYILNYKPCNLCIFERIPYFASSVLIVLNLEHFVLRKFKATPPPSLPTNRNFSLKKCDGNHPACQTFLGVGC